MEQTKRLTIALAGNPNSGKTTIFNSLTGSRQHVGNYPGVTVEKKEGQFTHKGITVKVIDLPGTYSLSAYSAEELITRNFIIEEKPDVIVNVIDASNIERNLYFTVQLMELGVPMLAVFNMVDDAKAKGIEFDYKKVKELLGAEVVQTVGNKGSGMAELLDAIIRTTESTNNKIEKHSVHYGKELEFEINKIKGMLITSENIEEKYKSRWLAIKLLENDQEIKKTITSDRINTVVREGEERLRSIFNDDPEIIVADSRYGFISGICREAIKTTIEARRSMSDKIDMVLTNRLLGLPIFFALMYMVFELTFTVGGPPMDLIDNFFGWLGGTIESFWPKGSESILKALLVEGVIGGVGGVVIFLPNILLLFLAIAVLEDTGYMARVAFIMDRVMHKIGLHGKSFIPMLIGFGCSVPAILATRTLENKRDRLTTMLVAPLMSCGARLPIYTLFIPIFFPTKWNGLVMWIIYFIGITLAILCAKLLRSTLFKGETTAFVMELPPYRIPTARSVFIHMWERGWLYLKKAGTVILGISIILWVMTTYPQKKVFSKNYDKMNTQAQMKYFDSIKKLNADLHLDNNSTVILDAIKTEKEMMDTQAKFHKNENGFVKASEAKAVKIAQLISSSKDGKILKAFLKTRDDIKKAMLKFNDSVKEIKRGTPEYIVMENGLNNRLNKIKNINKDVYYKVVLKFIENIEEPYLEKIKSITQSKQAEQIAFSVSGRIGKSLEPLLKPMGFNWKVGTALIGAFAAKEVFVAQMGVVYSVGNADENSESLRERIKKDYTPLAGFCIMLFCLISAPCMATIAATKRESNSWGWAIFQLLSLTILAYVVTVAVYQLGILFSIGV